jgi:hypothetical protein
MTSLILMLRFATKSPSSETPPIMNIASVARCANVTPGVVTRVIKRHMSGYNNGDNNEKWRWRKLQPHHVGFLVNKDTLNRWAHMSLNERAVQFHRKFPETVASRSTIRRVYQAYKIKFKQIKRGKRKIDFNDPNY